MYRNYYLQKRSCCSCNNKCDCEKNQDIIDETCNCVQNKENTNDTFPCGFSEDDMFPKNPMYAQSYVPWHIMDKTFIPNLGLKMGTIFPELVSPYMPGQSMKEIEYIKKTNIIEKECNK